MLRDGRSLLYLLPAEESHSPCLLGFCGALSFSFSVRMGFWVVLQRMCPMEMPSLSLSKEERKMQKAERATEIRGFEGEVKSRRGLVFCLLVGSLNGDLVTRD